MQLTDTGGGAAQSKNKAGASQSTSMNHIQSAAQLMDLALFNNAASTAFHAQGTTKLQKKCGSDGITDLSSRDLEPSGKQGATLDSKLANFSPESHRAWTAIHQDRKSAKKDVEENYMLSQNQLYNCEGANDNALHSRKQTFHVANKTVSQEVSATTKATSSINHGPSSKVTKRWPYGAQIVHQKEIIINDNFSNDDRQKEEVQSESSFSLQPTPATKNQSARKYELNSSKKPASPLKVPVNFLNRIEELDEQRQKDQLDAAEENDSDGDRMMDMIDQQAARGCKKNAVLTPDLTQPMTQTMTTQQSPSKSTKQQQFTPNSKRTRSKYIKKILKERLNIDCLGMLDEDSDGEEKTPVKSASNLQLGDETPQNIFDSYHVLLKEVGADAANDGLSQAFLQKNGGEVQREELESFTDMFSVRDLLGVGAFGVVLSVKNRVTKEKSALKIIAKERLSTRAQKILKNESTIMQTMGHPGVVALKRIFENQKFIIIEMELIPGGQLKRLFKLKDEKGERRPLTDLQASKVMKSLLQGVAYVHARDIVHRDLKPENILLLREEDDCYDIKIVDFGLSAEQNWRLRQNEKAGTLIYMAPEQLNKKGYSKKVDIWACGIMAYQLLSCGQHPCYEKGETDFASKLQNIERKPIEWRFGENFSALAKDFFLNLVQYPPSQRYDAATALQHPWITRNEGDKIPLNQQQELAMFQQERHLLKVIRLLYFAAHVKMNQFQEGNPDADLSPASKRLDTGILNLSQKKIDSKNSEFLAQHQKIQSQSFKVVTTTGTSQKNTIESEESVSPGLRFRKMRLTTSQFSQNFNKSQQPSSANGKMQTHNAFLLNSFTAYKELVQNQLKSGEQSTSADSKTNQAANKDLAACADKDATIAGQEQFSAKVGEQDVISSQTNMESNFIMGLKRQQNNSNFNGNNNNAFKKTNKRRNQTTKRQMTEQIGTVSSAFASSNMNFNPVSGKSNDSNNNALGLHQPLGINNHKPLEKQSSLILNGSTTAFQKFPSESQSKQFLHRVDSQTATAAAFTVHQTAHSSILVQSNLAKNNLASSGQENHATSRPGRNLVPARHLLNSDQQQSQHSTSMRPLINEQADDQSGITDRAANNAKYTLRFNAIEDDIPVTSEFNMSADPQLSPVKGNIKSRFGKNNHCNLQNQRVMPNYSAIETPNGANIPKRGLLIDHTLIDANRNLNNLTSYPMRKVTERETFGERGGKNFLSSTLSKDTSYNQQPLSAAHTIEGEGDGEVDTSTTQIFKNVSPRDYAYFNPGVAAAISASCYTKDLKPKTTNKARLAKQNSIQPFFKDSVYSNRGLLENMQDAVDAVVNTKDRQISSSVPEPDDMISESLTPQKRSEKKFGARKLIIDNSNGDKSPDFDDNATDDPNFSGIQRGLDFVKMSTYQDANNTALTGQAAAASPEIAAQKPSKVKKRVKNKRAQLRGQGHPAHHLNSKTLNHHYNNYHGHQDANYHHGPPIYRKMTGIMGSGEEQKINWFQLIQAEKTVGGSRILQEQISKQTAEEKLLRMGGANSHYKQQHQLKVGAGLNSEYFQKQKTEDNNISQQATSEPMSNQPAIATTSIHRNGRPGRSPLISLRSTQLSYPTIQHQQQSQHTTNQLQQPMSLVMNPTTSQEQQSQQCYSLEAGTASMNQFQQYYSSKGQATSVGSQISSKKQTQKLSNPVKQQHSHQYSLSSSQGATAAPLQYIINTTGGLNSQNLATPADVVTPITALKKQSTGTRFHNKSKTTIKKINQLSSEMKTDNSNNKQQNLAQAAKKAQSVCSSQPEVEQTEGVILFKRQGSSRKTLETAKLMSDAFKNNVQQAAKQPFQFSKSIAGLAYENISKPHQVLGDKVSPMIESEIGDGLKTSNTFAVNSPLNKMSICGLGDAPQYKQMDDMTSTISGVPSSIHSVPPLTQSMVSAHQPHSNQQKQHAKKKMSQSISQEHIIRPHPALSSNNQNRLPLNLPGQASNENFLNRINSKGQISSYVSNHSHSDISLPVFVRDAPPKNSNTKKEPGKAKRIKAMRNKSSSTSAIVNRFGENTKGQPQQELPMKDNQLEAIHGSAFKQTIFGAPPALISHGSSMGQTLEQQMQSGSNLPSTTAFQSSRQNQTSYQRLFKCSHQSPVKNNKLRAQKKRRDNTELQSAMSKEELTSMKDTGKARANQQNLAHSNSNNSRAQGQAIVGITSRGQNISQPPMSHFVPLANNGPSSGSLMHPATQQQSLRRNQTKIFEQRVQSHQQLAGLGSGQAPAVPHKPTPKMSKRANCKLQQDSSSTFTIQGVQLGATTTSGAATNQ